MSENVKEEKKSSKTVIILLLIIIILLLAGGITAIIFFMKKDNADLPDEGGNPLIQYDGAAVALSEDEFNKQYADALKKAEEGQIALRYRNVAYSEDGVNFACDIANSPANDKDVYFNIYTDATFTEQILLTGLVPPGQGITEFQSEIPFEPGEHTAVLVFTKVDDDHSTMLGQAKVTYTLVVEEQ